MRHHVWSVLKQMFFLMPDFVALLLTAIGLGVIFMNEALKKLEGKPRWRGFIVSLLVVFGLLAFISNQVQKAEDKRTADDLKQQQDTDRRVLTGQITTLIGGAQTAATSADVQALAAGISTGFDRIDKSIRGSGSDIAKAVKQTPGLNPASASSAPQQIRFTQKRVASTDPTIPFGLQIIIQSDASVSPVGLLLHFTGAIGDLKFFMAGQSMMMMVQSGVSPYTPNDGFIRLGYPALSPDSPIVATVLSASDVKLVSIEKISASMSASF